MSKLARALDHIKGAEGIIANAYRGDPAIWTSTAQGEFVKAMICLRDARVHIANARHSIEVVKDPMKH